MSVSREQQISLERRRGHFRARRRGLVCLIGFAVLLGACLPPSSRGSGGAGSDDGVAPECSTSPSPAPLPSGPTPSPIFVRPTPTPAPTFAVYTVRTGDSLNSIAKQLDTSARSLAFWNRQTYPSLDPDSPRYKPNRLDIGWTLFYLPGIILGDEDAPPLPSPGDVTQPAPSS
jgi:hypothetical protein